MGSVNGSEGPWLQRFANGKPVRKPKRKQPWKVSDPQHSWRFSCEENRKAVSVTGIPGCLCVTGLLCWNWLLIPTEILTVFPGLSVLPHCHSWRVPELLCEPWAGALCFTLSIHSTLRNGYCSCFTCYHSIPVCGLEPGWEPDLCRAGCLFMQTFSFLYIYPEILLSTSRVAQPIILIAADILGRKILPKIG